MEQDAQTGEGDSTAAQADGQTQGTHGKPAASAKAGGGKHGGGKAPADPNGPYKGVQWYRVTETAVVPSGGGQIKMSKGKQISTQSYDIEALVNAGVSMDKCPPPAWWKRTQDTGKSLARQ